MTDLTAALVSKACAIRYDALPDDVRTLARQCVLDTLGCALAGANEELARILLADLEADGGKPAATIIGHKARLPAPAAAMVNGAAGHALDFDDVNMAMPGHPSVAILPGLLALAETRRASGAAVIAAFVAGYELACRIGRLIAPGHYDELGFHATATVGCIGAAGACAHLLGLDERQFATALGIAATQAAGLKSMFGTMCKPLHAGSASANGLRAARLAARGFTSRVDALECAQGFAHTHSSDFHPELALAEPTNTYYIRYNLFKYHAACYLTHAPIEAARGLREQHHLTPQRIERIHLTLNEACDRVCNILAPSTGLEAKFSLRQTVAMALAGVETGALASYSEATAGDPRLIALRDRVEIDFVPRGAHTRADLQLTLTDGTVLSARHDSGIPADDVAAQGRRIAAKFAALAEPVIGTRAGDLAWVVERLDTLDDVSVLMVLCAT
ncbi:MAG: MmgE/PrpD family protein [Acetobacteraceae bacterium]